MQPLDGDLCLAAAGITVSNITSDGADITWSCYNEDEMFSVSYRTSDEEDWVESTSSAGVGTYTISGLESFTQYQIKLTPACAEDDSQDKIVTFTTYPSDDLITNLPYEEDFDDMDATEFNFSNNGPNGWYIGTAANNTYMDGVVTDGGGALYISNDEGATNNYSEEYSYSYAYMFVRFDTDAQNVISFDYKVEGEIVDVWWYDYLSVYLLPVDYQLPTDNLPSQDAIVTLPKQTAWRNASLVLPEEYSGNVYKLVFAWVNDDYEESTFPPAAAIDNIRIFSTSCFQVQDYDVAVTEENGSLSAEITVTDNNEGAEYLVEYRENGSTEWTEITSESPISIADLPYSTTYQVRITAICGDETAAPSSIGLFTTPCGAEATPWTESFDASPFIAPTCWERKSGQLPATGTVTTASLNDSETWYYESSRALNGVVSGKAKINIYYDNQHYWMITPSVELEEGTTYQLTFDFAITDYGNSNAPEPITDDRLAVLYSLDNGITWDAANGVIYADGDADTEHNISDINNIPARQIIRLVDADENPISGTVKFAFYAESLTDADGDNDWFIDNIAVEEYSDCQAPYSLSVTSVTDNSATLNFSTIGTSTEFEYVLVEGADGDIESGTSVTIQLSDLPLQLTELASATDFTLAVRAICEEGTSDWSLPVTFRTLAEAAIVPYTCDFEDPANTWSILGNDENTWAVGSATFAGESGNSAYISTDGGTTYSATIDYDYTFAYLYKDVDFGEDETNIWNLNFDWKCKGLVNGTSASGALVVYLLDPVSLPEGNLPDADPIAVLAEGMDWQNESVELGNITGMKRLVFLAFGYNNSAELSIPAAIDNVSIDIAACPSPQGLTASNATTTSVDIEWIGTSDSYLISYVASDSEDIITVEATASPYTLTDLQPATNYELGVQGICGEDTTQFSNIITFSTPCFDGAVVEYPWLEGFENGVNCWGQEQISGGYFWNATDVFSGVSGLTAAEGTKFAKINGSSRNSVTRLISPILDLTSLENPTLSFKHLQPVYSGDQDELSVYYRTSEEAEPVLLATYTNSITTWTEEIFQLTDVSSTFQIIFEANIQWGYGVYVDAVSITDGEESGETPDPEPEPCDIPTNLVVSNVTQTEATVSWEGTASSYEIRLNGGATDEVYTTVKTFANLTPATDYIFEVRAVCADGETSTWASISFSTLAEQGGEIIAPVATTVNVTNLTHNSATLHGNITMGNEPITSQGFKYQEVNAAEWITVEVAGTDISTTLNGLTPETTYRFKAFATTATQDAEGDVLTFATLDNSGLADVVNGAINAMIYPNPASDRAVLSVEGLTQSAQIVVSDAQGRILVKDTLSVGTETYELNTENYASGVYYVRIISGNNVATQKLVIK